MNSSVDNTVRRCRDVAMLADARSIKDLHFAYDHGYSKRKMPVISSKARSELAVEENETVETGMQNEVILIGIQKEKDHRG